MIDLYDAIVDELMEAFNKQNMPNRKYIRERIKQKHSHLIHPQLDLYIGRILNKLVTDGLLQRISGKYYAPGDKNRK